MVFLFFEVLVRFMAGESGAATPQLAKCMGCGEAFGSYGELVDHVVVAHNVTCQVCGERLSSKRELLLHNKERHGLG